MQGLENIRNKFMERVTNSDVKAGTCLILVAEGLKDASGSELYDETAPLDAFGHKRLAGAGKYVCDQLIKRFKADKIIVDFMKKEFPKTS